MSGRNNVCYQLRTPGGCRFGNKCKFSHDPDTDIKGRPPGPSSPVSPRPPTRTRNGTYQGGGGNHAPRDVCNFFWEGGKCQHGFDCIFRHEQMPKDYSAAAVDANPVPDDAPNTALDFFTADSLTETAGVARSRDHGLKPGEAHNLVKPYLLDGYTFVTPSSMESFIRILASVNRRNKAWVGAFLLTRNAIFSNSV